MENRIKLAKHAQKIIYFIATVEGWQNMPAPIVPLQHMDYPELIALGKEQMKEECSDLFFLPMGDKTPV